MPRTRAPETLQLDRDSVEEMTVHGPQQYMASERLVALRQLAELNGAHPRRWMRDVERFFMCHGATDVERLFVSRYALKGEACVYWCTLEAKFTATLDWGERLELDETIKLYISRLPVELAEQAPERFEGLD
ncbi:hypothetical protein Efla_002131 [Eimeria flavescens]